LSKTATKERKSFIRGGKDANMALASSLLMALAAAGLGYWIIALAADPRAENSQHGHFERQRRQRLRSTSLTFRRCEPLIDELGEFLRQLTSPQRLAELKHYLTMTGDRLPWEPHEFLAATLIEAAVCGVIAGTILSVVSWKIGLGIGIAAAVAYYVNALRGLKERAERRQNAFKRRLPFAVDLLALIISSGGTLRHGLGTVIEENQGHPLAEEFEVLQEKLAAARPLTQVLREFQQRFNDPDITELVIAIINGEELGTPMASILKGQAEQMRLKRAQWGEKAAAEAQVSIILPGFLTMLACILVIVGPFAIPAIEGLMAL
jgi:tight adherence protein C